MADDVSSVATAVWQGTFWLPQNASPSTGGQDPLFYFIYWLSVFFFILITGTILYFAVKYRKRKEGQRTAYIHGNTKLEVVWSVIPGILFILIFAWGFRSWMHLNLPPQDSLDVQVVGRKWDWLFTDVRTGAETSDLIVPINTPVKLTMNSVDVIHGFYVPDFRINRDVLPNQYTVLWFEADRLGSFPILCTQYCGTKHSQMVRYVRVVSKEDYEKAMIAAQGAGLTPAQLGERIFKGKGACASCHDVSPAKKRLVGPPLFAMYGAKQEVITSSGVRETVDFNENYIRESILDPNARAVVGYPSSMPTYQGQLSDKEISALIEYMKTLK